MNLLSRASRIVIKVGSSLLAGEERKPRARWLATLAEDVAALRAEGKHIIIVSSGAVALGRDRLCVGGRKLKLAEKQAAAACGQTALIEAWQAAFAPHKLHVAQVLLTLEDSDNRRRYLNARDTLETLLAAGVIPVINENDTVATAELRFGDNDRLAARVAQMTGAEVLILLSDVDGLYTANPRTDKKAKHIPEVPAITPEIEAFAGGIGSDVGSGGMVTKIAAARIATASGCHLLVVLGLPEHPIAALSAGARHTHFRALDNPENARRAWLSHKLSVAGEVVVDDGALAALKKGKSLLPAGVQEVRGNFERGDAVAILSGAGKEIGRGLAAFHSEDARQVIGKKSADFPEHLRGLGRDEMIHRDDMVLLDDR